MTTYDVDFKKKALNICLYFKFKYFLFERSEFLKSCVNLVFIILTLTSLDINSLINKTDMHV